MVEAASRHGYAEATVARVIALAGVSRATFYAHFGGREDCFLAAYRQVSAALRAAVGGAAESCPPAARPSAVLDALLAADPAALRLVLVEALAAPPPVRAEHEQLIADLERGVARFLDGQAPEGAIQLPAMALLAGVGEVLAARTLAGPPLDRPVLRADLGSWIDAYRLPPGTPPLPQRRWRDLGCFAPTVGPRLSGAPPPLLPRGRSAMPPAEAAAARRRRLLDATARLAATEGYAALTVARIAAAARVPRSAFYSHFEGKEEALLEAQTEALREGIAAAAAAYSPVAPWPRRVWSAGEALLADVAANADYARLDFVESYAAGPVAVRRRHQNQMAFAIFVEDGHRHVPGATPLPRACSQAIAGAVFGLMRALLVAGQTERMLSLLPAATYTIVTPFIGAGEAAARVQAWARAAP